MKRVGNVFVFIVVGVFLFYKFGYDKVDSKSHFTITSDTNVSRVKGTLVPFELKNNKRLAYAR